MPIMAFGLHWEADEIEWFPGRGRANAFRLLGRRNENNPALPCGTSAARSKVHEAVATGLVPTA
jgi:hypothetical protein